MIEVSDNSSRSKCLLPTAFSSSDQSPETRKGYKTSNNNPIAMKFSDNVFEIWPSTMLFNGEITTILAVLDDYSFLASANTLIPHSHQLNMFN